MLCAVQPLEQVAPQAPGPLGASETRRKVASPAARGLAQAAQLDRAGATSARGWLIEGRRALRVRCTPPSCCQPCRPAHAPRPVPVRGRSPAAEAARGRRAGGHAVVPRSRYGGRGRRVRGGARRRGPRGAPRHHGRRLPGGRPRAPPPCSAACLNPVHDDEDDEFAACSMSMRQGPAERPRLTCAHRALEPCAGAGGRLWRPGMHGTAQGRCLRRPGGRSPCHAQMRQRLRRLESRSTLPPPPATAAALRRGASARAARAQGLALGDSELREYTHGMFGHIARMLGPYFQPYLRACVAAAVESCGQARHSPRPPLLTAHPGLMRSQECRVRRLRAPESLCMPA